MAKYLTKVTEIYRFGTEEEVKNFIEELKKDSTFSILKYSSIKKERKQKGEIIDEWIQFSVTKMFNDEKEPDSFISVFYEVE